jgi:hypothetical protein
MAHANPLALGGTPELLAQRLSNAGCRPDCPICGCEEWMSLTQDEELVLTEVATRRPDRPAITDTSLAAYLVICSGCGFVRLHATNVLDRTSATREADPSSAQKPRPRKDRTRRA